MQWLINCFGQVFPGRNLIVSQRNWMEKSEWLLRRQTNQQIAYGNLHMLSHIERLQSDRNWSTRWIQAFIRKQGHCGLDHQSKKGTPSHQLCILAVITCAQYIVKYLCVSGKRLLGWLVRWMASWLEVHEIISVPLSSECNQRHLNYRQMHFRTSRQEREIKSDNRLCFGQKNRREL